MDRVAKVRRSRLRFLIHWLLLVLGLRRAALPQGYLPKAFPVSADWALASLAGFRWLLTALSFGQLEPGDVCAILDVFQEEVETEEFQQDFPPRPPVLAYGRA